MTAVRCKVCQKAFYVKPSHQKVGWGKYCSIICRSKAQQRGIIVSCTICNTNIYRSPKAQLHSKSGKFFCSKSCQTLWRNTIYQGENSKNWKTGEKAYRNILKRSGRVQICSLCGINDERILAAHHKDHIRTNNNLTNLVWLCLNCHYLVHHDSNLDKRIKKV
jgi:hypothetical protein